MAAHTTRFSGPVPDVPENPDYTIVHSMLDSVRFAAAMCATTESGHAASISTFVNEKGEPQLWHVFGPLEGPGWAVNAVGGALELFRVGRFKDDESLKSLAISLVDHVIEDGFVDLETGFITGYRNTQTGAFTLNCDGNNDWFCAGSMARIAHQMREFSREIPDDPRAPRLAGLAKRTAEWIIANVSRTPNGWWPRYTARDGSWTRDDDPLFQGSGDGLFIIDLLADLVRDGHEEFRGTLDTSCDAFVNAGGIFGSINHDTWDEHECVAYAVAFRSLWRAADVLGRPELRQFAYEKALAGLGRFRMMEDRNGVATTGLLYMEDTWDTAYLWENAEAAQAYLEAAAEVPEYRGKYTIAGLTILRAIAKHHHGELGFLTEGVDWNNHVGAKHHFDGAEFGAIQYTEPLLNNLHIVTPTLFYVERLGEDAKGT